MPNTRDVHRKAKQIRTSAKWRNLSSKAEEVLNVLEVSRASVRSILKDCMCIRWPANLCPSCWVRRRGELCQHMSGPSREAWNPEFYCMVITGNVWARPKNQVTDISVEEPFVFHAHKKGMFAHMHWACSLVFWHSWSCTVHYEFVPQEQIVKSIATLTPYSGWGKCGETVTWKLKFGDLFLDHVNAWALLCHCLNLCLETKWLLFWHPPYAPDLALCNFFVFSKVQAVWHLVSPQLK